MDIIIEDATTNLLEELYSVEQASFEEEAFSKQQISYLLTDYNALSLAARVDGRIVGFVIARVDLVRNRPVGHIMTLDVLPVYRRKGIGQRLMQEIESLLKQRGAIECRLEVRENNLAAIGLYEKLGYKKECQLEHYYGEAHGLYMRKAPL